jgi:hypothetical protein
VAGEGERVEFHFEELEHFNSSTIVALMQLIKKMERRKLKLVIVYAANLKWQKMTFDALRQFEGPGRSVEVRSV